MQTLTFLKDKEDLAGHINNAHIIDAVHITTDRSTGNLVVRAQIKVLGYVNKDSITNGKPRAVAYDIVMNNLQDHPDYQTALSVFAGGVMQALGVGTTMEMVTLPQPPPPVYYDEEPIVEEGT
jgi:hypothetical protein